MNFDFIYAPDIRLAKLLAKRHSAPKGTPPLKLPEGFTVTAHTGAMMTRSNSKQSICEAALVGADVTEIDLHFRPDGTPVISHDKPTDNDSGIELDTALSYVCRSKTIRLNIDVKSTENLSAVPRLLEKHGLTERAFYTGISTDFVEAARRDGGGLPYYLNHISDGSLASDSGIDEKIREIKDAGAIGINMNIGDCSARLCEKMHESGLLVSVWTLKKADDMVRILSYGADNITTKNPLKLMRIIETASGR